MLLPLSYQDNFIFDEPKVCLQLRDTALPNYFKTEIPYMGEACLSVCHSNLSQIFISNHWTAFKLNFTQFIIWICSSKGDNYMKIQRYFHYIPMDLYDGIVEYNQPVVSILSSSYVVAFLSADNLLSFFLLNS